jgi:hypothetical protein
MSDFFFFLSNKGRIYKRSLDGKNCKDFFKFD